MLGYRVPAPDEAMLISGGNRGKTGAPFRIVVGHGAFVLAGFRKARFLTLRMQEAGVHEDCVTQQGLNVRVTAVVAFKVANDDESIVNAGQRFLNDQSSMPSLTGQIFAGHLRAIVGSMTLEQIITDRQALAVQVLDASKEEMAKLGLLVDSFQIQTVDDAGSGYIDAMAAPHRAAIAQQAKIAQANANQAAAAAEQESQRKQIDYARQTAVAKADADQQTAVALATADRQAKIAQAETSAEVGKANAARDQAVQLASVAAQRAASIASAEAKSEVDKASATAAQAGPLAAAQAQLEVAEAQTRVTAQQALLKQQQLLVDVVRPAEAEADKIATLARAEAERQKILAEAAASSGAVLLQQALIDKLPDVTGAAASAFAGANVTILNGAEGASQMLTGAISQAFAVFDAMRQALPKPSENGSKDHLPVSK